MNKLSITAILSIIVLLTSCSKAPKRPEDVLAQVGDRIITVQEFIYRAELSPRPPGIKDKRECLDLLIGEKLMAQQAEKEGLGDNPLLQKLVADVQADAVIRQLYLDVVRDKVHISEEEVREAYAKMNQELVLRFFRTQSKEEAEKFRQALQQGKSFTSLLEQIYGEPVSDSTNCAVLRWGQAEEALENAAYQLKVGEVSPVIKTSKGYYVLELKNRIQNVVLTKADFAQKRRSIETVIRARKEAVVSNEYVARFMKDKKVVLKGNSFRHLVERLEKCIDFDKKPSNQLNPKLQRLKSREVRKVQDDIADHLDEKLVEFKGGSLTIGEFLEKLWIRGFPLDRESPDAFRRSLRQTIKIMVRDKLLAKEGYRRGLHRRKAVKDEVQLWRDYYLYVFLKEKILSQDPQIDLRTYVEDLKKEFPVYIDNDKLEKINLTDIQMLTLRGGYPAKLAVPMWPNF